MTEGRRKRSREQWVELGTSHKRDKALLLPLHYHTVPLSLLLSRYPICKMGAMIAAAPERVEQGIIHASQVLWAPPLCAKDFRNEKGSWKGQMLLFSPWLMETGARCPSLP